LQNRKGAQWTQLMVLKSDVAKFWQFGLRTETVLASGAPGRPTSMHRVRGKFEERCKSGEVEERIGAEARVLTRKIHQT